MKKAFDQTVRDLKREVNKKVLKVPRIEQKILDATSNEPWGPHGSLLADISDATRNHHEYWLIMSVIWKRINDTGKNWRHVYKGLTVLEYLVAHGSERVIDDIKERIYQISSLSGFRYIDSKGRDQGNNIRIKSQNLVALVNDKERIHEVREKAIANRDKFCSTFSRNGAHCSNYGYRYDDDHYRGRYGGRDEDRNGYGRERGYGDNDCYNREGDHYGRYSVDRYGTESYRGDDYRGRSREDDYKFCPRSMSADRAREHSPDDDENYSSQNGGANGSHVARPISEPHMNAPPSYEEATKGASNSVPDEKVEKTAAAPPPTSPSPPKPLSSETTNVIPPTSAAALANNSETFDFDEFDPRSAVSAAPASTSEEVDLFGGLSAEDSVNSLALVPVTSISTNSESDVPLSSGWQDNFEPRSSVLSIPNQVSQNPFGDPPFKAVPQENFTAQPQNVAPAPFQTTNGFESQPRPITEKAQISSGSDFGESFHGLTYTPNGQPALTPGFPPPQPPATPSNDVVGGLFPETTPVVPSQPIPSMGPARAQSAPPDFIAQSALAAALRVSTAASQNFHGQLGLQARAASTNQLSSLMRDAVASPNQFPRPGRVSQAAPLNLLGTPSTLQSSVTTTPGPAKSPQPEEKFETKSTVWADTINRGLVNLNISGPKTNPLADIGIDFDALNRKEKREKEKSSSSSSNSTNFVSTVSMGKAMGLGSGIGRAGAIGLPPSSNPVMGSGMGIGMGGGMGMGMGSNAYGGGMNQTMGMMGMDMNMGMNQGMAMWPQTGMFPGYTQMGMGAPMGGHGSQQYGGYR